MLKINFWCWFVTVLFYVQLLWFWSDLIFYFTKLYGIYVNVTWTRCESLWVLLKLGHCPWTILLQLMNDLIYIFVPLFFFLILKIEHFKIFQLCKIKTSFFSHDCGPQIIFMPCFVFTFPKGAIIRSHAVGNFEIQLFGEWSREAYESIAYENLSKWANQFLSVISKLMNCLGLKLVYSTRTMQNQE